MLKSTSLVRAISNKLASSLSRFHTRTPVLLNASPADIDDPQSSDVLFEETAQSNQRAENISRAMSYYLDQVAKREALMKSKTEEFEIGKRHLARIMGENPDMFTQDDIDKAIEYLLPSGLFSKRARPFLKHPEAYYPKSKLATFDKEGRPLHFLYYTGKPEFYQIIYEMTQKFYNLNKMEDALYLVKNRNRSQKNDANTKIDLTGSVWISQEELSKRLNTRIEDFNYQKFIVLLQKLADHPLSKQEQKFISQFQVPFTPPIKLSEIPELLVDQNGRSYQEVESTQRTAIVKLKMYEGTGEIKINSPEGLFDINYFATLTHREQILFPFKVVDKINKFDLEIEVNQGGMSCLAKAIRFACSKALCSFVSTDGIEKLRLAGLLSHDGRSKERKKPGQEGARRRYTWRAR